MEKKMPKVRTVAVGVALALVGGASVAGALTLMVAFPATTKIIKPKIMALVDEAGNVLFGASVPGKVEVTNFPAPSAAALAPSAASQIRTLHSSSGTTTACADNGFSGGVSHAFDTNVIPGGGGAFQSFSIPSGQVFLVTSFDWAATGVAASTNYTVELKFETVGGFNVSSAQSVGLADSAGHAGDSVTLGSPLVFKSGNLLCLRGDGAATVLTGSAQGFFAHDA